MTEAETRKIIDEQLRLAGWDADTENIRHSNGSRPQKGKYQAIAEWPVGKLFADYALFYGDLFIGIAEAKKYAKDIVSDLTQAKEYSRNASTLGYATLLNCNSKSYKVPFLFSTNGRNYNPQLDTKSGIWFLDIRNRTNNPRPLKGWPSPDGLMSWYDAEINEYNKNLKKESYDYLKDPHGLNLRDYQIKAIKAVETKIISEPDDRRALIAMATGTGKTRTVIGLCYRLIKSKRFKRILFLVDRNILGTQAMDFFKDIVVEDLHTFAKIYDVKEIGEKKPEIDTKLHFSTVQAMVKRIFNNEEGKNIPTIDTYDCIIVDEAHRGYILDKEMSEDEIEFKDEEDFRSKYKLVLDYFDAYRIGLTATPAVHTTDIFGNPVYRYSYRNAVIDGYLIDHEPPINIKTRLSEKGITWGKGEKPKVYDRENQSVEELDKLEDELHIEIEGFNKEVITERFNKVVCKELVKHLDPEDDKKTLIFAANDDHADLIVKLLKAEFKEEGIDVDDEAIVKITGSVYKPQEQVNKFKNEKYPSIVVTVDLLTTGVDVEEICNLVFIRRVRSRILYDQMIGRATRRADHLGKEVFKIFDAVRLYESLKDFSEMKPVVAKPDQNFQDLIEETKKIKDNKNLKRQLEQIIAKLQRKKNLSDKNLEKFKNLSNGLTPQDLISNLRKFEAESAKNYLSKNLYLFKFLDEMKSVPPIQLISEHEDELIGVERGYGNGVKPEDYLDGFRRFVKENMNKIPALKIICKSPSDLTRKDLRELKFTLDELGYNQTRLNIAWKEAKNEDIAADIIAYIRTFALNLPLISHEERIKNAIKKVKSLTKWNAVQLRWLDRFEMQLIKEDIIDREALDEEPFKRDGGYDRINKIFGNSVTSVIQLINKNLYSRSA